jgi:general secretion pathway protein G
MSRVRDVPAYRWANCKAVEIASRRGGFTIIELVVTVAILAVLATAAVPMSELVHQRSKERELRAALREIREGIDAYKRAFDDNRIEHLADDSGYPRKLGVLVTGVQDVKDENKRKIYFLRRIPRDPLADEDTAAEETWGIRSYESPPDAPKEGKDVFDVYSLSDGVGLNGVPYREW